MAGVSTPRTASSNTVITFSGFGSFMPKHPSRFRKAGIRSDWNSSTTAADSPRAATRCSSWTARKSVKVAWMRRYQWRSRPMRRAILEGTPVRPSHPTTGRPATNSAARWTGCRSISRRTTMITSFLPRNGSESPWPGSSWRKRLRSGRPDCGLSALPAIRPLVACRTQQEEMKMSTTEGAP
jgi:hypothetical protein